MVLMPYSAALTLAQRPTTTYATLLTCLVVFLLQATTGVTEHLLYYPRSWNPITMVTSSLAHADVFHLLSNMIFFMAFAPALELLIGDRLRYLGFMLLVAIAVGISYSISVAIGSNSDLPSLGFSGII